MRVTVKAHARLHFGFIDPDGVSGRQFGSIGLAIDTPAIMLEAIPADRLSVEGQERGRVHALAHRFLRHYKLRQGAQIVVKTTIPAHVGLGSGTQLALSVASVLTRLFSIDANVRELAAVMGRGGRSGIGIAAFERGGFIVDAGRRANAGRTVESRVLSVERTPPTIVRYSFPEDWTFVVAIPRVGQGLAGTVETRAFHGLAGRSAAAAGRLSRMLLMQMLPAILERDPVVFGESLTRIQRIVGAWFRPVQGGTFATTQGAALVKAMSRAGALGVGQSSWGPAVYGLAKDQDQADHLKHQVTKAMQERVDAVIFLANASNRGAGIRA